MRVRGCGGGSVRQRTSGRRVGVEDELLDCHNLLAVAELLQLAQERLDLLDEGLPLCALQLTEDLFYKEVSMRCHAGAREELTDDIVSILVAHQAKQRALTPVVGGGQGGDDVVALALVAKLDAFLNHVTGKLVLGVGQKLRHDDLDHAITVLRIAILDDVLDHVVAELVGDEVGSAGMKFSQNGLTVDLLTVLQHALDDAAAVGVCSKAVDLASEGVDDELHILRGHTLDSLLDNVVAILVTHTLENVVLQLLDHSGLLIRENVLEGLLNHPASVHLGGEGENVSTHLVGEDLFLGLVAVLKELLDNVVAENVGHELQAVGLDLSEDLLLLIAVGGLQLLLDEARAMLIARELNNVVIDVLQLIPLITLAVGSEFFQEGAADDLGGIMLTVSAGRKSSCAEITQLSHRIESLEGIQTGLLIALVVVGGRHLHALEGASRGLDKVLVLEVSQATLESRCLVVGHASTRVAVLSINTGIQRAVHASVVRRRDGAGIRTTRTRLIGQVHVLRTFGAIAREGLVGGIIVVLELTPRERAIEGRVGDVRGPLGSLAGESVVVQLQFVEARAKVHRVAAIAAIDAVVIGVVGGVSGVDGSLSIGGRIVGHVRKRGSRLGRRHAVRNARGQ